MKRTAPDGVIPCHCTGRNAIMRQEQAMNRQFIPNMPGTNPICRA